MHPYIHTCTHTDVPDDSKTYAYVCTYVRMYEYMNIRIEVCMVGLWKGLMTRFWGTVSFFLRIS